MECRKSISIVVIIVMMLVSVPLVDELNHGSRYDNRSDENAQGTIELSRPKVGYFTRNDGQIEDTRIRFVYQCPGMAIGFLRSGCTILLETEMSGGSSVITMSFEGSAPTEPIGLKESTHRSSYFLGSDSSEWIEGVPSFGRLIYRDLYEGIDLVFYPMDTGVKYDFIVGPHTDPSLIRMAYEGVEDLIVRSDGSLLVRTENGEGFSEGAPYCYQVEEDRRIQIDSRFEVHDSNVVTFSLDEDEYDPSRELVIDPMISSTYIGGSGQDQAYDLALDGQDNVYVVGRTKSDDFPVSDNAFQQTMNVSDYDVVVFKLNPDLSQLLYSTYIGGDRDESAYQIAVDGGGSVYIAGTTDSPEFPVTEGCFDNTSNGKADSFVLKLNPDGTDLVYSTFLGGSGRDSVSGIAEDGDGNAYVTGETSSDDFPLTPGCYDTTADEMRGQIYVTKMNSDGSDLSYSTLIGTGGFEDPSSIEIDGQGNAYVVGYTSASSFPTIPGSYDESFNGGADVIVFKLNHNGSDLLASTFLGGTGSHYDQGMGIALDSVGDVYVTGYAATEDFPTTSGCYDSTYAGKEPMFEQDAFLAKLDGDLTELKFSTFLGKGGSEKGHAIVVDDEFNPILIGYTSSTNFPTTEDGSGKGSEEHYKIYVAKFNVKGSKLKYSTTLDAEPRNFNTGGIALDSNGNVVLTGHTESDVFPTSENAYQGQRKGSSDAIVMKLEPVSPESGEEGSGFLFGPGIITLLICVGVATVLMGRDRKVDPA